MVGRHGDLMAAAIHREFRHGNGVRIGRLPRSLSSLKCLDTLHQRFHAVRSLDSDCQMCPTGAGGVWRSKLTFANP